MITDWIIIGLLAGFLFLNALGVALLVRYAPEMIKALRARHTYPTIAGLEDTTSVNLDMTYEILALKEYFRTGYQRLDAIEQRLHDQLKIIQITREGPHAYDPNRPAGRRPEGMERDGE